MALTAKKVYAILKRQISDMEAKLNSPVRYRGTVATADLLPLNPDIGDMYNIESKSVYGEAGMNVAWNGVVWDTMGAPIDMSLYIKSNELADWVKQQNKPTYTANEVGALPADTKSPSKTSELKNDSGFLTKVPDSYLYGTDTTLKESGKAADAKATGDKFTKMSADISKKLDKNQGVENSGKIAGINEAGNIVPMFPVGVEYNEETNCLEFGSDQKMELNRGIGLDSTLTKTGSAADAGATGKEISSLKEDMTSKADKTALVKTNRKLDALWKLNQGISYEFQTDDTEAYQKTVPSGAKMASVKSIGGKTIVWNQMVQNGDFSLNSMWSAVGSTISVEGNTGIFTATEAALTNNKIEAYQILSGNVVKGHKYCVRFEYNLSVDINDQSVLNLGSVSTKIPVVGAGTWGKFNSIATVNVASNIFDLYFFFDSLSVGDTVKLRNVQLFDLTQMFGSGNEPSTREEFEAMFPADYYLYNAGELMSAPVNEVTYSDTKTQETSYQIPQAILNLPGYGWSAGDARNEVNWENKQYIQRVGAVDLGTLNWTASGDIQYDGNSTYKSNSLNTVIRRYSTYSANSICEKFNIVKVNDTNRNEYEYSIGDDKAAYPLQFTVKSTFCTDENDFKNKINGIMLYYELAEPIITDISDLIGNTFQEPLEVEAGGTFTFKNSNGDNYRIPVPSSEEYVISLAEVAK